MPRTQRLFTALTPLFLLVLCMIAPGGCTCSGIPLPSPPQILLCRTHTPGRPTQPSSHRGTKTVPVGTIAGTFGSTSTGTATYSIPLVTVPGRAGVEPQIALTYSSAGDDGVVGVGFSLAGLSSIARCARNLADDGEIRSVRYDAGDELCLDGKRLVPVGQQQPGLVEYRTFPDTFTKVIGHYPVGKEATKSAISFEAHLPSGLVIEYGAAESERPLAKNGAPRAWLSTKAHDGRGNAMTYTYCFADDDGYAAEVALDEIRYTSFEGAPAQEASRAVKFVYGIKDAADLRIVYSGGMALQRSLRLDQIEMLGPADALVRRYGLTYELGPTTQRTRLTQIEECAGDGVCKPPTRFQYSGGVAGFQEIATALPAPTSVHASPMLVDIDGDGLDDLVLPDTNASLSTPQNPITEWRVARNRGESASPPYWTKAALAFSEEWPQVANPSAPADPGLLQPELGTALDYDQDGRMDVLLHDVYDSKPNWLVLLAQPDHTFKLLDTGVARPFPLGVSPKPPILTSPGGSMHLADLDGDGVPDLIQCEDHSAMATGDPVEAAWTVHLWTPAHDGVAAGFDLAGEPLAPLTGFACNTEFYTVDLDGDGKVNLVVETMLTYGGTERTPGATYSALTRRSDGSFEVVDTHLDLVARGGRVVFLDVNGDGLPDAVQSGFSDHALRTFLNTGTGFVILPGPSLGTAGSGDQDTFFRIAAPIDYNGDGRQDLLMPLPGGSLRGHSDVIPAWAVLQATGIGNEVTFSLVDPGLPFEPALGGAAITLAEPRGPRIGDVNGDGAEDVVLLVAGAFTVFQSLAPDQDLLVALVGGMNAHEPTDPGFVPDVRISYGHLTDAWMTSGAVAGDPAREGSLYLSHADAANDCAYPSSCAVGPRRVVSAYTLNNGADGERRFGVRYRDGRYHRLGRGFLGFGERLVTDLGTGAGTTDFYDNRTETTAGGVPVFPFAGQVQHAWQWAPGLQSQPKPDQIELSFTDLTLTVVPTNDAATYFTLLTDRRIRRVQGVLSGPVEAYVEKVEAGGGATLLRDSLEHVSDFDTFGNVLAVDVTTAGVDLTLHIDRTFTNDTTQWVLGQLQTQRECSTAALLSQCQKLTRTTTIFGETESESTESDDGSLETKLHISYPSRDVFGNVLEVTADDAHDHHRSSSTSYDPEGIFPIKHTNAAGHIVLTEYDAGLGVLTRRTDPNQLVTRREYDGFGRLDLETRPDGTQTTVTLARSRAGGADQKSWRVLQQSTTTGGADDTVELDGRGRPIRRWWHGPAALPDTGGPPRLMQEIVHDARGERVARRSVPVREDTPQGQVLFDEYDFDALGREVRHTTPWGALVQTAYDGAEVQRTDGLGKKTVVTHDPLERPVAVMDAALGVTQYSYGPFGALYTVTDPGGALTRTTRDAYGRIRQLDDPDQGTTVSIHDGFGELVSSIDALGRTVTLEYDALGRTTKRVDQDGAQSFTTTWSWDKSAHGIGKLGRLTGPDGQKTYAYNGVGQVKALILDVAGQSDSLVASLGYDALGRVATITYPAPAGAAPFVVARDHDLHGYVHTVRDSTTNFPYWRLTDVDDAGRVRQEVFGNGVSTERGYFADKQLLQSFVTTHDATTIQDLAYTYDARRSLASRSDALQPQNPTERFRYDALDRLTCAYFGASEDASAPCAMGYGYDPNGNLTSKSDIGALVYNDPLHPHAVTGAGGESFGYDAVGNQTSRPGGATVAYTPFGLPRKITQGGKTVSFGYAGDEQRICKTTSDAETIYFGRLYERVTVTASAAKAHRYHVHSPERVVAVVTRGGAEAGTRYLHVDHLGSVDVVTREDGSVAEQRSYDPFGQRRSPVWGKPAPASFASGTTLGFTGHEGDDELGLVNMKGRIFDPRIGRFLTTDPLVSAPLSGQSWNPYSYVLNNPISYVDPSGFDPAGLDGSTLSDMPGGLGLSFTGPTYAGPPAPPVTVVEGPREAAQVGAEARAVDVGTTGGASGYVPASVAAVGAVAVVPVTAPGVPGVPVQVPGTPWVGGPLKAPGPFGPNAFGPGSFVEPPLPGAVPLEAPGLPTGPAVAPGTTVGGVLGGVAFVLSMGMIFSGDANLEVPQEYDVVLYKDKASGFQNHHGVLDVWAANNIPGYIRRAPNSPTIRLSTIHHDTTRKVFPDWVKERTGRPIAPIDWTTVSSREVLELSERMFNAAEVPHDARTEYYRVFTRYIYGLK